MAAEQLELSAAHMFAQSSTLFAATTFEVALVESAGDVTTQSHLEPVKPEGHALNTNRYTKAAMIPTTIITTSAMPIFL